MELSGQIDEIEISTTGWFTCIESALGHRFMSTGNDDLDSCITCGGEWRLVNNGHGTGKYTANNGDQADHCTYDTSMVHGYERLCENDNGRPCAEALGSDDGVCVHTGHGCNCVLCD